MWLLPRLMRLSRERGLQLYHDDADAVPPFHAVAVREGVTFAETRRALDDLSMLRAVRPILDICRAIDVGTITLSLSIPR